MAVSDRRLAKSPYIRMAQRDARDEDEFVNGFHFVVLDGRDI
jgi:hypothetical protein